MSGFRLTQTTIFTDSLLGTHYTYALGRNLYITVAVQPNFAVDGAGATSEAMIHGAAEAFRGLPGTTPGGLRGFEIVHDTAATLSIGSRVVPGHIVAADVRRGSQQRYEAWHVFGLDTHYVRVMVESAGGGTSSPDHEAVRRQVEEFVRAVVPAVASAWRL